MTDLNYQRLGGAAGICAMVLLLVGFLLPGAPPKADDSLQEVTSFLVDKRGALLAGSFLIGLGSAVFLVWLVALRDRLEASGRDAVLPRVLFGAGVVAVAMNFGGAAVTAGAVFEVAELGDEALNRGLLDISVELFTISGFAIATFLTVAALSAGATGALPRWAASTAWIAAALQLLSTIAIFAGSGFFASGGAMAFIAFVTVVAWIVAVSMVMLREARPAPAPL